MLTKVKITKAEKYAIREQALSASVREFFMKSFGCVRKVKNLYTDYLYKELESFGYSGGSELPSIKLPEVTYWKKQYPYLKEVDSLALANAKIDFESAVKNYNEEHDHVTYTKRAKRRADAGTEPLSFRELKGMPKFHSKRKGHFSYKTNCQNSSGKDTITLTGNKLHLPKLKEDIELVMHRSFPEKAVIKNVTVSMEGDGKFYVSICYTLETKMDLSFQKKVLAGDDSFINSLNILGLDYSQEHFYVDSEGRKADLPKYFRKSEEKLARLQRQLSRMEYDSNNYKKKLRQIQRLHTKIKNQRRDICQKESAKLVSKYDVIVVEDINLRAMGGALSLGKNLHDNGFGMFRQMLSYKLEEKGSVLVKTDKWYPSTKTCSHCGYKNDRIKLGTKEWTCPNCGEHHDRDINAAINIREEGRRILRDYLTKHLEEKEKAERRTEALSNARKNKSKTAKKAG